MPFGRDLARQRVMRLDIERAALRRFGGLEDDAQNAAHRFIQHGLVQLAGPHGVYHGLHASILRAGHFQIETAAQRSHPIVHRAPIGDHQPLKAPFVLEDVHQQVMMFRAYVPLILL